ncbi:MAG TPA: ABC transporter substrate-binding protein [Gemmatimonadaceae bacterium]|nr:ABC transporter substrate-binding protein [Gemmatimonadaceae bacterium]
MPRRALIALACLTMFACQQHATGYVIAAAGPWKQGYGQMNRLGIELAVDEINANGGIDGHKLEVIYRDDEGDGETAAKIAQEFVANINISAVVGHVNSGAMVAAARIYDGHLAALATTATSPDLTGVSPWVFRVISSDSANGIDLARFAARLGAQRAAILYENNAYGRGLTDAFRRSFPGEIISIDPITDAGDQNFEPFVSFYKLKSPEIVFVAGTEASGMALLREAKRQSLNARFLGGDGWTGVVADTAAAEGAYVGAPFTDADTRPEVRRFVQAFLAKNQRLPDGNSALAYDATMVIARALAKQGASRPRVREFLAGLGSRTAITGVTGPIAFHKNGDPIGKSFVMTRVRHGALVPESQK